MHLSPLQIGSLKRQSLSTNGPSTASYTSSRVISSPALPKMKPPFGPRIDLTSPALARWAAETRSVEAISPVETTLPGSAARSTTVCRAKEAASDILNRTAIGIDPLSKQSGASIPD